MKKGGFVNYLSLGYIVLCLFWFILDYVYRLEDKLNYYMPKIPIAKKSVIIEAAKIKCELPDEFVTDSCLVSADRIINSNNKIVICINRDFCPREINFDKIKHYVYNESVEAKEVIIEAIAGHIKGYTEKS